MLLVSKENLYSSGFEGANRKLTTVKNVKLKIIKRVKLLKSICFEIKILRKQDFNDTLIRMF